MKSSSVLKNPLTTKKVGVLSEDEDDCEESNVRNLGSGGKMCATRKRHIP